MNHPLHELTIPCGCLIKFQRYNLNVVSSVQISIKCEECSQRANSIQKLANDYLKEYENDKKSTSKTVKS